MKLASVSAILSADSLIPLVPFGKLVEVMGWVKTKRGSKNVSFVTINDGSTFKNLQVVVEADRQIDLSKVTSGASIRVVGQAVESKGSGQTVDFIAEAIEVLGECGDEYPIQPKKHSMEFFREHNNLKSRTALFQAIFRIRHRMSFAVHDYFDRAKFLHVHTPIITSSDAEGAGEVFKIAPVDKGEFFGKEAGLTVSGQLEAETAALGLGRVYTFGPTFRAENSHTSRHLSEFWMVEPEIAFADLGYVCMAAESLLKFVIKCVLDECRDELRYLESYIQEDEKNLKKEERSEPLISKLQGIVDSEFEIVDYTRAFGILKNSKPNKKGRFEFPVEEWGMDLSSEHERFLVEKHFKKPIIIVDYPKSCKSFYMRDNDDGMTVSAMDVLFPGIGEVVGGSAREERLEILESKVEDFGIEKEEMKWYLDTRRFGTVPHAGFGLGFDRLVQFVTGMKNIRDVVLYPRTPGKI